MSGDPTRLSQIFQNLLNNAAKYTPPGGRIELRSKRVGNEVVVCVRDNGIGIPVELQPRVFELFTRVHTEHAIKTSGLGIGLEGSSTSRAQGEKVRRILIVDDNQDAANSLSMLLQADNRTTRVSFDGLTTPALAETFMPGAHRLGSERRSKTLSGRGLRSVTTRDDDV